MAIITLDHTFHYLKPLLEEQVLACLSGIIRVPPEEDMICTKIEDSIGNPMFLPVANLCSL